MKRAIIAAIFGNQRTKPIWIGTEEEAIVKERVGSLAWLRKQLEAADKDLLCEIVKGIVETLMGNDADGKRGRQHLRCLVPTTQPGSGESS